eukprot:Opistho-2@95103
MSAADQSDCAWRATDHSNNALCRQISTDLHSSSELDDAEVSKLLKDIENMGVEDDNSGSCDSSSTGTGGVLYEYGFQDSDNHTDSTDYDDDDDDDGAIDGAAAPAHSAASFSNEFAKTRATV